MFICICINILRSAEKDKKLYSDKIYSHLKNTLDISYRNAFNFDKQLIYEVLQSIIDGHISNDISVEAKTLFSSIATIYNKM